VALELVLKEMKVYFFCIGLLAGGGQLLISGSEGRHHHRKKKINFVERKMKIHVISSRRESTRFS
jgi:hypothetical protein